MTSGRMFHVTHVGVRHLARCQVSRPDSWLDVSRETRLRRQWCPVQIERFVATVHVSRGTSWPVSPFRGHSRPVSAALARRETGCCVEFDAAPVDRAARSPYSSLWDRVVALAAARPAFRKSPNAQPTPAQQSVTVNRFVRVPRAAGFKPANIRHQACNRHLVQADGPERWVFHSRAACLATRRPTLCSSVSISA